MEEKDQNFLDMVIAMSDLAALKVIDGKPDQLTVTYTTSAVLEAQKVWMESQLDGWYQDLGKKFNVKIVGKWFKGGQQYSLVLELEIPIYVDWSVISDTGFRKELITAVRKYFVQRIIQEHPLPFNAEAFWEIPIVPGAMCKYIFTKYQEDPILSEKEAEIIEKDNFKQAVKRAIEENGGVFIAIRVELIMDGKYKVGYLEYKRTGIIFMDFWAKDPLTNALNDVIKRYFKDRLNLSPHGETDVV